MRLRLLACAWPKHAPGPGISGVAGTRRLCLSLETRCISIRSVRRPIGRSVRHSGTILAGTILEPATGSGLIERPDRLLHPRRFIGKRFALRGRGWRASREEMRLAGSSGRSNRDVSVRDAQTFPVGHNGHVTRHEMTALQLYRTDGVHVGAAASKIFGGNSRDAIADLIIDEHALHV